MEWYTSIVVQFAPKLVATVGDCHAAANIRVFAKKVASVLTAQCCMKGYALIQ